MSNADVHVASKSITLDVISELAGVQPDSGAAALRAQRPEATLHAQGSYAALFDPEDAADLSMPERFAAALRVARLHAADEAAAHYEARLAVAGASPDNPRLLAVLRHAELLATGPARATWSDLQALADAGLSTRAIVSLSQVIAFVSFQVRVIHSLQLLGATTVGGHARPAGSAALHRPPVSGVTRVQPGPPARIIPPDPAIRRPTAFTVEQLDWSPWLEPIQLADANLKQAAALEGTRGNSPYFRLLARDIDVLTERTLTDRGIFYTPGGAPRADRELSAAATSRLNGCIYCASVHARLAAQLGKRPEDIDRLLRKGVTPGTDLGLDDRWQAVVDFAVALAPTPPVATQQHVAKLREIGLSELEMLDIAQAAAFFAWANRLMLTLGEPYYPQSTPS